MTVFSKTRRRALREASEPGHGDPFNDLSPEGRESLRQLVVNLMFWMGNYSVYGVKQVLTVWNKSAELRKWLAAHVNLASYTLYYGAATKPGQEVKVGDPWQGPKGPQHWTTNESYARSFTRTRSGASGTLGVLVVGHAKGRQVIVDTERLSFIGGRYPKPFAEIVKHSEAIELFNGRTIGEGEVLTTSEVKGQVAEVVGAQSVKTERVFSEARRRALVEAAGPSASEFVSEFLKRHPKLVPVVRSRHLDFVDTASMKRGEAWQEGEHKIVLSPKFWALASDRDRDAVLAHEVGHAVLAQYGLSDFTALAQKHGIDVWDNLPFAQGNMDEAFSDAFAEYFLNPSELKRRYEPWFELVKALV